MLEVWRAPEDELVADFDQTEWGPRPDSAGEAWAGLGKALKAS